jgi:6-phosphogluconolactonase
MSARLKLLPLVALFTACAHCGSSSDGNGAADAAGDASVVPLDAALDATAPDAGPADATPDVVSPEDAGLEGLTEASTVDAAIAMPAHTYVYVGGYSDDDPFRMYEIDRTSLALIEIQQNADVGPQASWICPSANGNMLYVANESDGEPGITVLKVDRLTGIPSKVGHAPAFDKSFVFCSLDPSGKYLLAASYNGGNVVVFPVLPDGLLGPRVDAESFGDAQSHSVRVHPSGKWAYVPNKKLDSVAQFVFGSDGKLTANPAGASFSRTSPLFDGPRHLAFSSDGALAFVISEVGNELTSFAVEANGTLRELNRKPRLPTGYSQVDNGAHVLAHPGGKFVYGSNRGSNTIAAFAYDSAGQLTLLEHEPSRGKTPRGFDIDPAGQFMVVANQEASGGGGGSVSVFAIEADGRLTAKASPLTGLASPAAVAIVGI